MVKHREAALRRRRCAVACILMLIGCADGPPFDPGDGPSPDDASSADGGPRDAVLGTDMAYPIDGDVDGIPRDARPSDALRINDIMAPDGMTDGIGSHLDMGSPTLDAMVLPMADAMIIPRPDAAVAEGPPPYPADRDQSPLTPWIADRLRAIADRAPRAPDVFAKVGDSVTVSRAFMHCFAGDAVDLDGRDALWATIEHFAEGDAGGGDPFRRVSEAATVGWSAGAVLQGAPTPLDVEFDALDPRFAVVMFGTNDIQGRDVDRYAIQMWDLVDRIVDGGTIPILSTIMPRDDDADADALVPRYNAVVRALAQGRQVPLVDFHRRLLPLPDHGLGPDRLHPSAAPTGACDLSPGGLEHGYNIRNLLTLTALDRARRALVEPAPDPPSPLQQALGTVDDPIPIDRLPFTDLRDTRDAAGDALDAYPGCDAPQDESGPEVVYALELERATIVRARVFDRGAVDIDLHLLADPADPDACLDRNHRTIEASLGPGTWYFVLDTYVDGGVERAGEYLFTLIAD